MFHSLITPPGLLLLIIFVAAVATHKRIKYGQQGLWAALIALYLFCTPYVSYLLTVGLYNYPQLTAEQLKKPLPNSSIVLLGAGIRDNAIEFGGVDTLGKTGLMRVRYAAWIYSWSKLPILTSGGATGQNGSSEARVMMDVLKEEFHVPVKWIDENSYNTTENAAEAAKILMSQGINSVYLVTSAEHMRRSLNQFKALGFTVVPAPTGYLNYPSWHSLNSWLPSAGDLKASANAWHEWLGLIRDWFKG